MQYGYGNNSGEGFKENRSQVSNEYDDIIGHVRKNQLEVTDYQILEQLRNMSSPGSPSIQEIMQKKKSDPNYYPNLRRAASP